MTAEAKTPTIKYYALQSALLDDQLAKSDCTVFATFLEYRNAGQAWPGAETIAIVTGLNIRTVRLSMRRLEERGYIEIISHGGGRNKTNVWAVQTLQISPFKARIKRAAERWLNRPSLSASSPDTKTRAKRSETLAENVKNAGETTSRTLTYKTQLKNPSVPTARPRGAGGMRKRISILARHARAGDEGARAELGFLRDYESMESDEYRFLVGVLDELEGAEA